MRADELALLDTKRESLSILELPQIPIDFDLQLCGWFDRRVVGFQLRYHLRGPTSVREIVRKKGTHSRIIESIQCSEL